MSEDKENILLDSSGPPTENHHKIIDVIDSPDNIGNNLLPQSHCSSGKSFLIIKSNVKEKAAYYETINTPSDDKISVSRAQMGDKNVEFPSIFCDPKSNIKSNNLSISTTTEKNSEHDKKVSYELLPEKFEESLHQATPITETKDSNKNPNINNNSNGETIEDLKNVLSVELSTNTISFHDESVIDAIRKIPNQLDNGDTLEMKPITEFAQNNEVAKRLPKVSDLIQDLVLSLNIMLKPGCIAHIKKCKNIVMANLNHTSVAESLLYNPPSSGEIICNVNLSNILLTVKDDYVYIDYKNLIKNGHGSKVDLFSVFFHILLVIRSHEGSTTYDSNVYTFVKRCEADKFNLKCHLKDDKWYKLFDSINFPSLRCGFGLIFEFYLLKIDVKKPFVNIEKFRKKLTPIKSIAEIIKNMGSPLLFTNIGTLRLSQLDIASNDDVISKTIYPRNPLAGDITLTGSLSYNVTSKCEGQLGISMEINGVLVQEYRDCELMVWGLRGGKISKQTGEIKDIDVEIPFTEFSSSADICACGECCYFTVLLNKSIKNIPLSERASSDGERKCRFSARAESLSDAVLWCTWINNCRKSFLKWSESIKLT